MNDEPANPFTPVDFTRQDESDDNLFYREPRLAVHIDDQAIEAVGDFFREVIPPSSVVLDLMSSWRSHWPAGHPKARFVGLGLNAVEMQENPDLDEHVVHDVNRDPHLPFGDASFDAVVLTVSIQYLTRPIEVFQDVHRSLRPGGIFLISFSNRMFSSKAVRIWRATNDEYHMKIVASYFYLAGNFEEVKGICRNPQRQPFDDPVYVVMARKPTLG